QAGQDARVAHQIDVISIQNRRRHIGRAFVATPGDFVSAVQIARAAEFNRGDHLGRKSRRENHQAVADYRCGYRVTLQTCGPPELRAGLWIIRDQELTATDDQLRSLRGVGDDRSRPAYRDRTFDAPDFVASLFVQRGHERVFAVEFLVAEQD